METFLCTVIVFLQHPSLQSAGLKSQRFAFNTTHTSYMNFFLLLFCFGKQCESLTALYRKCTLQPWVHILENCLVFALLYFTVLVLSSFKFAGCLLSLRITKLEGTRGVIFLQLAYGCELLPLQSKSSCLKTL